jgi:predicted CopG family antitoxin
MAAKTITVDAETYDLLAGEKRDNESLGEVVKRRLRSGKTAADLAYDLKDVCLAEDTLDHLENVVRERGGSVANSPALNTED